MRSGKLVRGGRVISGVAAAATIVQTINRNRSASSPPLMTVASSVPRMLRATVDGEYHGLTRFKLGLLGGAVLYVVSPIDILPDFLLLAIGIVDDAVVLSWVAAALIDEAEKFLLWEAALPGR